MSDIVEESCDFCCADAKTERARVTEPGLFALCQKCVRVWDKATATQIASTKAVAKPDPEDAQVRTLFRALRYLVHSTLPNIAADNPERWRLFHDLDLELDRRTCKECGRTICVCGHIEKAANRLGRA